MTKVNLAELPCALQIRGRIGRPKPPAERGQYGVAVAGVAGYGDDGTAGLPAGVGIYQMRHCTNGYVPVRMKLYDQKYTTSEILQANRNKFREAMDLWKTLTKQQKAVYLKKVEHLKMHAHNYFVKEYLRNN
jgi:hypothetical protein